MTFKLDAVFTTAAGQSLRKAFWWSSGVDGDQGTVYCSAHPLSPFHDATLFMSQESKALGSDNRYYYGVTTTNAGPQTGRYILQGFAVS